jgi:hypothetical protein
MAMAGKLIAISAAPAALAIAAACASRPLQPVAPSRISAVGSMEQFGAGAVAMSGDGRYVVMELAMTARVAFFNAHPDGWLELLDTRTVRRGRTEISLPLNALERTGGSAFGAAPANPSMQNCTTRPGINTTERGTARRNCLAQNAAEEARRGAVLSPSPRVRFRDALLIVVWDQARDPDPPPGDLSYEQFRVPGGSAVYRAVPEIMFRTRVTSWAAYFIR